jgi:uncharacterized protein YoaH (UPF0181 family)
MREETRHRQAFNAYVALGPNRSIDALHAEIAAVPRALGFRRVPGTRTLFRWSTELRWQERLTDLEREARLRDAEENVAALREMNHRHTQEGLTLQRKAIERFQTLDPADITPGEAIRALAEGVRLERLGRGEVTERTEIERRDDHDLGTFSIAELRALAELAAGRAAGDSTPQPPQPRRLDAGLSDDRREADGADAGPA